MSEYANIREILGHLIGKKLLDVSQHDKEDFEAGRDSFVELMFEDGNTLKFYCLGGEQYKANAPFCFSNPDANDDGLYHPSSEDSESHRWAVVEQHTDDGPIDHAIPCAGKFHELDEGCWCVPRKEFRDDGSWFFNHREEAAQ